MLTMMLIICVLCSYLYVDLGSSVGVPLGDVLCQLCIVDDVRLQLWQLPLHITAMPFDDPQQPVYGTRVPLWGKSCKVKLLSLQDDDVPAHEVVSMKCSNGIPAGGIQLLHAMTSKHHLHLALVRVL